MIENEPERLLEDQRHYRIKIGGYQGNLCRKPQSADLMILLSPFKVTPVTAQRIYEHFGAKSVEILRENPYELCQVSGFGFKRVDAIVRKGDTPLNSPMRIHGAIYAVLDEQRGEKGHLYLDGEALAKATYQLLNEKNSDSAA